MNRTDAKWILLRELVKWKRRGYDELAARVGDSERYERQCRSGTPYQMEFQFLWDASPQGAVRVLGSIDDGGLRAWFPLSYGLLARPR